MEILDVVNESAGKIVLDLIDDDGRANIDQLDVCVILFEFINGLVGHFVVANSSAEIKSSSLRVLPSVIGRCSLDLTDVVHNKILVVANRLDKQRFNASIVAGFINPLTASFGRIGGIEDRNHTPVLFKPAKHVVHGSLGSGLPHFFALWIVRIKEFGRRLRCALFTTIATNIEDASWYPNPSEIAHCYNGQLDIHLKRLDRTYLFQL